MKDCTQCGKCCIKYADGGLVASQAEIERWEIERPDIYAYVRDGQIWCAPDSGEKLSYCPWLQGQSPPYQCGIYADRPGDCRDYPTNLTDMVRDECEMLEEKDLLNPERAQRVLHLLNLRSI